MSLRRRLALACGAWLLACAAGTAGAASTGALDTLDECVARVSQQANARDITALCPGLEAALRELGLDGALPRDWQARNALPDLVRIAHRYRDEPPAASADPGAMAGVLEQLAAEQTVPSKRSWWEAFKAWVGKWLQGAGSGGVPWLDRFLERLSHSVGLVQVVTVSLLAIVVAMVVMLFVRELRAAGLLRQRRAAGTAATSTTAPHAEEVVTDFANAPLRDQPALLLRMLVARLRANGQLRQERSLTHTELVRHSSFGDDEGRASFEGVARLAERVMYGACDPDPQQAGAIIGDGRRLLARLEAATSPR
jgi:hypothetical protein